MIRRLSMLCAIGLFLLAGCGNKGPLYLPPADQPATSGDSTERDQ